MYVAWKKNKISQYAVGIALLLLFTSVAQAKDPFFKFNKTGVRQGFIQQDQKIFWSGGIIDLLNHEEFIIDTPKRGKFVRSRVHYVKWQPEESNGHVIIYTHGFQSHAGWFYESAEKLKSLGYTVYAFDRIGSGRSSGGYSYVGPELSSDGVPHLLKGEGNIGSWTSYTQTYHLMKQIAKVENPGKSITLWANSFGANHLTAYILEYEPDDVASYIFTTPGFFSTFPLPFPVQDLISAAPGTYFPTTIPEQDGDQGAYLFTELEPYKSAIANDGLSLRSVTREFYFNVVEVQGYHFGKTATRSFLDDTRRFYLIVDGDPIMDTAATVNYVSQHADNATMKLYSGGPNARHYLAFTEDADQVISDIDQFIMGVL